MYGSTLDIAPTDFQAAPLISNAATCEFVEDDDISPYVSCALIPAAVAVLKANTYLQFRLALGQPTNNNNAPDQIKFWAGDSQSPPLLTVVSGYPGDSIATAPYFMQGNTVNDIPNAGVLATGAAGSGSSAKANVVLGVGVAIGGLGLVSIVSVFMTKKSAAAGSQASKAVPVEGGKGKGFARESRVAPVDEYPGKASTPPQAKRANPKTLDSPSETLAQEPGVISLGSNAAAGVLAKAGAGVQTHNMPSSVSGGDDSDTVRAHTPPPTAAPTFSASKKVVKSSPRVDQAKYAASDSDKGSDSGADSQSDPDISVISPSPKAKKKKRRSRSRDRKSKSDRRSKSRSKV